MHPPFSLLAPKKTGRARSKRNRLGRQMALPPFAANTRARERDPSENFGFSVGREQKPGNFIGVQPREPELQERAKPDLPCFSFRCRCRPSGWGIQRGGTAVPPLCVVRGCGGEVETPPHFSSRGLGTVLFSKENGPQAFLWQGQRKWGFIFEVFLRQRHLPPSVFCRKSAKFTPRYGPAASAGRNSVFAACRWPPLRG